MHGSHCISGNAITVGIHARIRSMPSYWYHTCRQVYRAQNFQGVLVWLAGVCPINALVWYKYIDAW
jgi:hypothetical protein